MSNKKLYSVNGHSVQIYKVNAKKQINLGFTDMTNVVAALRQSGSIVNVKQGQKLHGIERAECLRLVAIWKDEIKVQKEQTAQRLARAEMHQSCFAGYDC